MDKRKFRSMNICYQANGRIDVAIWRDGYRSVYKGISMAQYARIDTLFRRVQNQDVLSGHNRIRFYPSWRGTVAHFDNYVITR